MPLVLTATQQVELEAKPQDSRGNPATVQNPVWSVSEPNVLDLQVDAGNPLKCVVAAVGPVDETSMVEFNADADLGEGVIPIIGTLDVVVTSGQAVVVAISAGTPTEQPPS